MGIRNFLVAAGAVALLATPSLAKDANRAVKKDRAAIGMMSRPVINKQLQEVKRSSRMAVITTDIRQKRYLAFADEAIPGAAVSRRTIGGDAISDGP